MSESTPSSDGLSETEKFSERWDKVIYKAQGSPYEDLSVSALAKSTGLRTWKRPGSRFIKGETLSRYVYLSFEELLEVEELDLKSATHLLEICETTFSFEKECDDLISFGGVEKQSNSQRIKFVEEHGLYQDYPLKLANLDADIAELCDCEGITTLLQLMEFLDQLADRTLIGGAYQKLKNIFAYGDEKGLQKNFPYRIGHRGFHYPEAIAFCVDRISESDYQQVQSYFDGRDSRTKGFFKKRAPMPTAITQKLLPEILECTLYFCQRQPNLLARLCTPNYLRRELIFMDNPQAEEVLSWLTQLTLSVFKGSDAPAIKEDLKDLDIETDTPMMLELKELIEDEA